LDEEQIQTISEKENRISLSFGKKTKASTEYKNVKIPLTVSEDDIFLTEYL
jgi:hypothetical protein